MKLANLAIIAFFFFFLLFLLLPTPCVLSTLLFCNCSFWPNKLCKGYSVCSHVSFSTLSNISILRLSQQDLSLRSLRLLQSCSLLLKNLLISSFCFSLCLAKWSFNFLIFFRIFLGMHQGLVRVTRLSAFCIVVLDCQIEELRWKGTVWFFCQILWLTNSDFNLYFNLSVSLYFL